jgi:tRNA(Arg) A34 adenosine deaminase TadA
MNRIQRMFRLANDAAKVIDKNGLRRKYRLAAVGIRNDGVIVFSSNLPIAVPNPKAHAEYRLCAKLTPGSTVWVVRIDRSGHYVMAKPCRSCTSRMVKYGVKRCYYTISDNEWGVLDL